MPRTPRGPTRKAWDALHIPTVEPIPKRVEYAANFAVYIELTDRQKADLAALRSLILTAGDLSRFYRASTVSDVLLKTLQVMHLHLGGPGSDAILYVIQYPDSVLFVTLDTHKHLRTRPPGGGLNLLARRDYEAKVKVQIEVANAKILESTARLVKRLKPPKDP